MPTKPKAAQQQISWRKIFSPQIIICTVLCIVCLIMAVVCVLIPGTKEISVTSPVEDMEVLDAITSDQRVVQKFTSDDNYTKFGLYYANFGNYVQGGDLYIDVKNSKQETSSFTYRISNIADNGFLYINYPLEKNETYNVDIHISSEAQGITFFTTAAKNYDATMSINNHLEDRSIIMAFSNETKDIFSAWYYILAISLIMCYMALTVDRSIYDKKNH